jgi:hypothetical protein
MLNLFKDLINKNNRKKYLILNYTYDSKDTNDIRIIKTIEENKEIDFFIFLIPYESFLHFFDEIYINNYLVKNNKTLIIYLGGFPLNKRNKYSNLFFKYLDSFYFFNNWLSNNLLPDDVNLEVNKFVSLNVLKECRPYRYYFHIKINEELDLDKNKSIIFRLIKNEKTISINNEFFVYEKEKLKNYKNNKFNQNNIDDNYLSGFFDIVCETLMDSFFVTEKTIRPLYFKKPFVVLSCCNFHYFFKKKYNFKLYEEIIDYSFDKIEDDKERIDAFVHEIKRIDTKYTIEDIYNLTKEKVDYNHKVLVDSFNKKSNNEYLYDFVISQKKEEKFTENFYNEFQKKFLESKDVYF